MFTIWGNFNCLKMVLAAASQVGFVSAKVVVIYYNLKIVAKDSWITRTENLHTGVVVHWPMCDSPNMFLVF